MEFYFALWPFLRIFAADKPKSKETMDDYPADTFKQ